MDEKKELWVQKGLSLGQVMLVPLSRLDVFVHTCLTNLCLAETNIPGKEESSGFVGEVKPESDSNGYNLQVESIMHCIKLKYTSQHL